MMTKFRAYRLKGSIFAIGKVSSWKGGVKEVVSWERKNLPLRKYLPGKKEGPPRRIISLQV